MLRTMRSICRGRPCAIPFVMSALLAISWGSAVAGTDFEDFQELNLDDLLDDVIRTASRHLQSVADAPGPVTVISGSEIRASGAATLVDALRFAPGVDVVYLNASDLQLNIRGFSGELANKTLVLVDGRSVYWEFQGAIPWDALDVSVEEIDRIEILRSPGSVIYGPNAFSGVIHILTRRPSTAVESTTLVMEGGNPDMARGSLLRFGRMGAFSYRLSGEWRGVEGWRSEEPLWSRGSKWNVALERPMGRGRLALDGGFTEGTGYTVNSFASTARREHDYGYLRAEYDATPSFHVRGYWNSTASKGKIHGMQSGNLVPFAVDSYDLEAYFEPFQSGGIRSVVGGNVRVFRGESDVTDGPFSQELFGLFGEARITPAPDLDLTVGLRGDRYPLTGVTVSPRLAAQWRVAPKHSVRAAFSSAYREPSFFESFLHTEQDISAEISPELPKDTVTIDVHGNDELEPERITSYEIGYQMRWKGLWLRMDGYHQRMKDFITLSTLRTQDIGDYVGAPPGWAIVPAEVSYLNTWHARSTGTEIGIDLFPATGFRLFGNYSYQWITKRGDGSKTWSHYTESPVQKINLGFSRDLMRETRMTLWVQGVGKTDWDRISAGGRVPAYMTLNAGLSRGIGRSVEVNASVSNILDQEHYEYPAQDLFGSPNGVQSVGRRILGSLRLRF